MNSQEIKKCPFCGEEILATAKKCKHCGEWLDIDAKPTKEQITVCPFCAEEIDAKSQTCPLCEELIPKDVEQEKPQKKKSILAKTWGVITVIAAIGFFILLKTDILDEPI